MVGASLLKVPQYNGLLRRLNRLRGQSRPQ